MKKKFMRTFIGFLISLCVFVYGSPSQIFAAEQSVDNMVFATIKNSSTGETIQVEPTNIVTEIKSTKLNENAELCTKCVEVEFSVPEDTLPVRRASSSTSEGDSSGSYRADLTITYVKYYDSSYKTNMYLLKTVNGSWTQEDAHVGLHNQSVAYGCNGARPNVSNQNRTINLSNKSFSINTGFTKYISDNFMGNICGAAMHAKLQRAGNTAKWDFTVTCNVVNNGFTWSW